MQLRRLHEQTYRAASTRLGQRYYCIPRLFKPTHSFLFHNNGDGTFTDVTRGTAIERAMGKGLGVVATDINNDGRMDLFVANDTVQDFLFVNRGNNKWEEIALMAEVAYSESGRARSGMGVDAADINGDGWEDLFVSNINDEMFSLYTNNKNETFFDAAHKHGVARGYAPAQRLGAEVFRLRQRRPDGPDTRQWPSRRQHRVKLRAGEVQGAVVALPPGARACCTMSPQKPGRPSRSRWPLAAWLWATTITTALSTCWWALTAAHRCCYTTAAVPETIG